MIFFLILLLINVRSYLVKTMKNVEVLRQLPILADDLICKGQGSDADVIKIDVDEAKADYLTPTTRTTLSQKFDTLSSTWRYENGVVSSVSEMALDPSYQEIIGMGEVAIPMILEELRESPNHWFAALTAISGQSPVKYDHRGNINEMIKDWLKWGKEEGYIL